MGTKLSDLLADHPHTGAALASGDVLAVLDVSDTTEAATGTTKGITASELAIGVASVGSFATDSELTTHTADTTSVHGIADTSVLATATTLATAVSNHAAATDPHADRAYADTVGNLKLAKASNLSDLANAATARTNLGLAAIAASGSASDLSAGTVPSARLGTGGAGLGAKVLADNQTFVDLPTGTIGGSTGSVTRALILSNGTGGLTVQASGNLSQDSSGNLIIEDATGAREIWFSTVSTAPMARRSGTLLQILSNTGTFSGSGLQTGRLEIQDPGNPSSFGDVQVMVSRAVAFSDGVDYNRALKVGVNGNELAASNGSSGYVGFRSKWQAASVGANVASATTIAPTAGLFHLTGTTPVQTISVPYTDFTGCIRIIPDGAGTLITGGNVALGVTLVVGRLLTLAWDGTAWYPSYV